MKIVFEKIVPAAGSSFAILDKRAPAFDGRFHFHPEIEITLIERSTGRRVVGDSIEPFAPGDLVLLGENLPHQYISDRTAFANDGLARLTKGLTKGDITLFPEKRAMSPFSEPSDEDALARAKVIQFREHFLGDAWLELPEFK